ncbi:MAG: MoxR family ATPase [Actinomycetota bacterium]|nr:MoxR family ATPase [Actinomycetota bacterium]
MKDASIARTRELSSHVLDEVQKAIVGKRDALEMVLLGILSGGHILVEDFPGLAKTLIASCFAKTLGIDFNRIQFTPDLLPGDITGGFIYDQRDARFEFRKGALFTNLLLGDEINRAPPKTQAALLEAMQERQVTVEGSTYQLDAPFIVIATQNPIEYEGTYPLPEAQLDRFMLRVGIGYPTADEEWEILDRRIERREDEVHLQQIVDAAGLLAMQASLERVFLSENVGRYIVALVTATRTDPEVQVGASPRGAIAVMKLSRAKALVAGRDFVTPDDVKSVTVAALSHRLTLRPELWVRRVTGEQVVSRIVDRVPTPATEEDAAAG